MVVPVKLCKKINPRLWVSGLLLWMMTFSFGICALENGANTAPRALLPTWEFLRWILTPLAWDASPSAEVAGYAIYLVQADTMVTNRIEVGNSLTVTVPLVVGSSNLIFATAYTSEGVESEPSNMLEYIPPPLTQPKLLKLDDGMVQLQFRTSPLARCRVEWADRIKNPHWQTLAIVAADILGKVAYTDSEAAESETRFYRVTKE